MNDLRVRIMYSKNYPATLIGHLDTMAMLQRAMRMACWPIAFTQGFNPRIKLSSGPPLSLGFYSDCEYVDVHLKRRLSRYRAGLLAGKVISGVRVEDISELPDSDSGINSLISGFRYRIDCGGIKPPGEGEFRGGRIFRENGDIYIDVLKNEGNISNPVKMTGIENYRFRKVKTLLESHDDLQEEN